MSTPQTVMLKPYRAISTSTQALIADAVIEERHHDEMVMTDQPVEAGSTITDHAYKLPAELDLVYAWTFSAPNRDISFLKDVYQKLLGLQVTRTLVEVFTGKRLYQNMLVKTIGLTTDKETENILRINVGLRELLTATTQVVNLTPAAQQQFPQKTAPTLDQGTQTLQPAPNFNAGAVPNP